MPRLIFKEAADLTALLGPGAEPFGRLRARQAGVMAPLSPPSFPRRKFSWWAATAAEFAAVAGAAFLACVLCIGA